MLNNEQATPDRYALNNAHDEAQLRMAGPAAVYYGTRKRQLGIAQGWECLEVGAGGPSIPN